MQINDKAAFDPSTDKEMFKEIDNMIEQGQRNAAQGVLGRQLGLTKVVNMKLKLTELKKNIEKEIGAVKNEVKAKVPVNAAPVEGQDEVEALAQAKEKAESAVQL